MGMVTLILLNQYDLTLVTKAEASKRLSSSELIPVAIHGKSAGGRWYPIETTAGDILKVDVQNWPNR
jgi:hypothetical protein